MTATKVHELCSSPADARIATRPFQRAPLDPDPVGKERTGRLLGGRYRLLGPLGMGSMGQVYRAFDLRRQRACAVKVVSPAAPASLQAQQRFQHEAQIVARLSHPNIIEVYEFNEDIDRTPFLVMELLEGEDLQNVLNQSGRLPLATSLRILGEVGAGLHYAHELGVVHRDVKPNNVFLCRSQRPGSGEQRSAKLLDFGLAKLIADGPQAAEAWVPPPAQMTSGLVVGTPVYMAPETLLGESLVADPRSDQWALAVMGYELLSGQLPFDHEDPLRVGRLICGSDPVPLRSLVPGLPAHLYQAIEVAMSKRPERRFASVADFLRALAKQPPREPLAITSTAASAERSSPESVAIDRMILPAIGGPATAALAEATVALPAATLRTPLPPSAALQTVQYSAAELSALTQRARELGAGPAGAASTSPALRHAPSTTPSSPSGQPAAAAPPWTPAAAASESIATTAMVRPSRSLLSRRPEKAIALLLGVLLVSALLLLAAYLR